MAQLDSTIVSTPRMVMAQDSITRLANATQYGVNDALSNHETTPTVAGYFTLPVASRDGGGFTFTDFALYKTDQDQASAAFDVMLFDTVPAVAGFNDNAEIAITDAEWLACQEYVPFSAGGWRNVVSGDLQTVRKVFGFVCAAGDVNAYGIVVVKATYTPASGEKLTLTAKGYQD